MKAMYYKTSGFIQHTGNIIDLDELRRQALARESGSPQQDSLARKPQEALRVSEEEPAFRPVVLTVTPEERRRARRERRAWRLDTCASLAVIAMTLVFALRVLL